MTPPSVDLMLADLERLVRCESPSSDLDAVHRCADLLVEIGHDRLGATATRTVVGGRPVVQFGPAEPAVLLLGHLDTVHPLGTLMTTPYRVADGRAHGPGVLDMKGGLVQALHAIPNARHGHDVGLLVTSDEELGSPDSRPFIEEAAKRAGAVLVLESSRGGRLKSARKGVSQYDLQVTGRAAHAGLDPDRGANACLGLAHAVLAIADLADAGRGTTVTPTVASAGTTANTVPDRAAVLVDVRAASVAEQERVDDGMRALTSALAGVSLDLRGGINRPPLAPQASERLLGIAQEVAAELGWPALEGAHVGGGSDGNFTAALGIETLDGLGAVGDGEHTVTEWADVAALAERTELLSRLIDRIVEVECS